jgi:hypothetical protein
MCDPDRAGEGEKGREKFEKELTSVELVTKKLVGLLPARVTVVGSMVKMVVCSKGSVEVGTVSEAAAATRVGVGWMGIVTCSSSKPAR